MVRTEFMQNDRDPDAPSLSVPSGWILLGRGLLPRPLFALGRYLAVLVVVAGLGALYLWQAESLSRLHSATLQLEYETSRLNMDSTELALQLAQWISPAYIDAAAQR